MHKTVYLVRHAQSQPTTELPERDWPLSERGRAQARRLAGVLAGLGIEEVHTSPYQRCRDTIAPFVAASAVPVHEHHDLRERLIALAVLDDFLTVWHRSWEDFGFALPGCESSHAAQRRVHDTVAAICARTAASTLAINSHGNALALLLNRLDGRFHLERATAMRNPDVFRVTYHAGELRWDEGFTAPGLEEFASHQADTPIVRRRPG